MHITKKVLSSFSGWLHLRSAQVYQGSRPWAVCIRQRFCSSCCRGMSSHIWHLGEKKQQKALFSYTKTMCYNLKSYESESHKF